MRTRISNRERRGLDPSEHTEGKRFMQVVRLHESAYPELRFLHHVPNGGWRRKAVAGQLKSEGVRAGVLDYCWPYRSELYSGLYLEMKSMTGRASPEQRKFAAFVDSQGFKSAFCRGWEEAWRVVCEYAGIKSRIA